MIHYVQGVETYKYMVKWNVKEMEELSLHE